MSALVEIGKQWLTQNCMDGDNRENSGNADTHIFNSPDLYELVEDLIEHVEEHGLSKEY